MEDIVGYAIMLGLLGLIGWGLLRGFSSPPGKPKVCTTCGHLGPTTTQTRGSIVIEIVLWLAFLIPGLIYSIWRLSSRRQVCAKCGGETLVPADSPVGRKLVRDTAE